MKIEKDLSDEFPGLRVLELKMSQLEIKKSDSLLVEFRRKKQEEIRDKIRTSEVIKDLPIIRAYRDFYWKVGIDPTKTRPAGEALTRRILAGRDLPTINTFVDAYNIASAESSVAIAAFDSETIEHESLIMRRAVKSEPFLGIGMDSAICLSGVEVVIEDTESKRLIAIYPYRDSEDSKVTERSSAVLLMMCGVPGITEADLLSALKLTKEYVERFCKFKREESLC